MTASPARSRSSLPESWRVRLPVFEGPLDLLLHLVRVNELKVAEIPVARICDQFHEYLMLMEELNLDIAGDYIYEAAMLIQLKSKILLPKLRDAEGNEIEDDPREELVQRLLEYRRLKEVAQSMAEVDRLRLGVWTRKAKPTWKAVDEEEEIELGDVSLYDLLGALKTVLDRFDRENPEPMHLRGESFGIRPQFERLMGLLKKGRAHDLAEDLRGLSCRGEAVAAFLAVLELVRLGLVRLHQSEAGLALYRTTRELAANELETISS